MDVLLLLVREAPRTVSPEEMLDVVWGGVFVSDNSVHRAIATLRKALGDDAKAPRYIQTVTKRGYRLLEAAIPQTARTSVRARSRIAKSNDWIFASRPPNKAYAIMDR